MNTEIKNLLAFFGLIAIFVLAIYSCLWVVSFGSDVVDRYEKVGYLEKEINKIEDVLDDCQKQKMGWVGSIRMSNGMLVTDDLCKKPSPVTN